MKKFYTAKYDRVFKTVMCDEDNPYMMQEFLSRLLKKKVEVIKFLKNELPIRNTQERVKTIDVLVLIENKYIHIELNSENKKWLHIRNFLFFSTIFTKKVKRGEEYDTATKFLHIDFTYGIGKKEKEIDKYYVMNKDGNRYVDNIEIVEYNMDKIMSFWYNQDEEEIKKYKHLIMLDLTKEDLRKITKGDSFMKEFENKVTELNEDETFQSAMTYEEDQKFILNTEKKLAFEEGVEQGISSGVEKEKEAIAKTLLSMGMSLEDISKATNLSIDEINKLK